MKHLYLCILFFFILNSSSLSQNFTWQWQNSQPYGFTIQRSLILPNGTYLQFGEMSTMLKSTNQGVTWTRTTPDSMNNFRNIYGAYFIDDNTGYFCGEGGMICKTTDGGNTWTHQSSGVTTNLLEITFYDANIGFAGGSSAVFLKTTNGGDTWNKIEFGTTSGEVYRINIAPGSNGSVIYMGSGVAVTGRVSKSTDGGNTFTAAPGYTLTTAVRGVNFVDADTGYIANGVYQIFKTTNGGQTFTEVLDPGTGVFYDLKILSAGNIAAVGSRGELFKSTDWGSTWQQYNTELNSTVYTFAVNNNLLIAAGSGGVMSKSTDSGNSWTLMSKTASLEELRNVQFVNSQVGYAVGGGSTIGVVIKTTDGGENWFQLPFTSNYWIRSQGWINENTGFVGKRGQYLYRTTDGGATFDSVNTGISSTTANWNAIAFANSDTGYIAGADGNYCRTTDGGATWTILPSSLHHGTNIIYDIAVIDARTVVSIGAAGKVYKTTDAGATFADLSNLGTTNAMYGVHFLNSSRGYIVGSSGYIFLTTNGGLSWSQYDIGTSTLYSVKAITENIVWVSGSTGTVGFSTDGGTSYTVSTSFPVNTLSRTIYGLNFFNDKLWAVGTTGTVIQGNTDPVPVELTSFTAEVINNKVTLKWQTATETNNKGFEIERRNNGSFLWDKISYVSGKGSTSEISQYEYSDYAAVSGTYIYRLKQIDFNGSCSYSTEAEVTMGLPLAFNLEQNYPNPFNPATKISFEIPQKQFITLKVYDILGNLVKELINEEREAGRYSIEFKADDLSSGTYIYTIRTGSYTHSRKMLLIK